MATYRRAQRELFATEVTPAEPVPKAIKEELQTLLATLLLGVVRNRSMVLPAKGVPNDQDDG